MQKNVFEQDEDDEGKPKKKSNTVMVKKKKKKVNQLRAIKTQHQNGLSNMMNKMVISPVTTKKQDIKHYSVGKKTYEQMINETKKPRRMPPPQIQPLIQKQETYSSQEQEGQSDLIFHKLGTNIINNKNKKKKHLFEIGEHQIESLDKEGQYEGVFSKLKRDRIKKPQQEQRAKQKLKTKPKTKEQLMIEFLKSKYNKNKDFYELQQKLANVFISTQFSNQLIPQSVNQPQLRPQSSPYASRLTPIKQQNANKSHYQAQAQTPSPYNSQYANQNQSQNMPYSYQITSQLYPSYSPEFSYHNQPHFQDKSLDQQQNHYSFKPHQKP